MIKLFGKEDQVKENKVRENKMKSGIMLGKKKKKNPSWALAGGLPQFENWFVSALKAESVFSSSHSI